MKSKIIIVQGHPCLGKSSLCNKLKNDLKFCKYFKVDNFKTYLWDKKGFSNVIEREELSNEAFDNFLAVLEYTINNDGYDYILLDYPFKNIKWSKLIELLPKYDVDVKMIYLYTKQITEFYNEILKRFSSSDYHKGNHAMSYKDGRGSGYEIEYPNPFKDLDTIENTLRVEIGFDKYNMSVSYEDILDFIVGDKEQ